MNRLTELYRKHFPEDDRPDDAITLELSQQLPDEFTQIPDAAADLDRIQKAIAEANKPGPLDYAKQATGSLIRSAADLFASAPESIAVTAHYLEQKLPLPGADKDKPLSEYPTMKAAEAIRSAGEKVSPEPVPELHDSFMATKVPQGIGSALAFMAGGAATKVLKIPSLLGIAGLGAASQGVEGFRDAQQHGASEDQAFASFLLNAGVGTTEVLPLNRMLHRLEGISGGTLSKFLLNAAGDTVEETLQEAFQSGAGDVIAKNIVKYDQDRKLFQNMRDDAAAGGITGLLFSLATQAVGRHIGGGARSRDESYPAKADTTRSESATKAVESPTNEANPAAAYELTDEARAHIRDLAFREAIGVTSEKDHRAIADLYASRDREALALFLAEKARRSEEQRIIDQAVSELAKVPETPAEPAPAPAPVGVAPGPVKEEAPAAEAVPAVPEYLQRARQAAAEVTANEVSTPKDSGSQPGVSGTTDRSAPAVGTPVAGSSPTVDASAQAAQQKDIDRLIQYYEAERGKVAEQIEAGQTEAKVKRGNQVASVNLPRRLDFLSRRLARLTERKEKGLPPGAQFDLMDLDLETVGPQAYVPIASTDENFTPELGEKLTAQSSPVGGLAKNNTHRLTAFRAPGGQVVVVGTFKQNAKLVKKGASGYQVADPARPGKSMPIEELMGQGFKPFASMRVIDPMNNPVLTYPNAEAYARDFGDAATLVQAARDTTAAVAEQVRQWGTTQETAVDPEEVELASQLEEAANQVVSPQIGPNLSIRDVKFSTALSGELFDNIESIAEGRTAELNDVTTTLDDIGQAGGKLAEELGRLLMAVRNTRTDYVEAVSRRIQEAYNQSGSRKAFSGIISVQARPKDTPAVGSSPVDSGRAHDTRPGATQSKAAEVVDAANKTNIAPTDSQKASGRYEKGSFEVEGLEISIETPKGAIRSGKDPKRPWAVVMPANYGYVKGTEGRDGDAVDVYVGPDPEAPKVWVIDQVDPKTKKFDEHKAMLGFRSKAEAMAAYVGAFSDNSGAQRIGEMTVMPMQDFVDWVNDGVTDAPLAYGRPAKAVKFRRVTQGDYGATPERLRAMWAAAMDAARAQGLDVRLIQRAVGDSVSGEWTPGQLVIAMYDMLNPSEEDFITLMHEVGHEIFAGLDAEMQDRLHNALENSRPPGKMGSEEQMVEWVATKIMQEGFNADEARGWAQKIWRLLKDIYLRAAMALQEARFGTANAITADAYFQNRVESYLARDFAAVAITTYFGGPKYRDVGFVDDEFAEPSADVDSAALASRDVAKHNAVDDVLHLMWATWSSLGHNTAGLSFEQFAQGGNFVDIELPAESIAALNNKLTAVGRTVDPALRIAGLPSKSFQQRAAVLAHKTLRGLWTALNERRRSAEWNLSAKNQSNLVDRLTNSNVRLRDITTKYTNADVMLRAARATIETLLVDFRNDTKAVKTLARKAGILTQTIRDVEGRMDRGLMRQYEAALNRMWARFSGAEGSQQFSDMLQKVAELQNIDWENDPTQTIREKLVAAALADPVLEPIVAPEVDNRALLSVLVSFGRTNANVMDFLQIRRSDAIAERTVLNNALTKAMEDSKDAINQARAMTSKLPRLARVADRLLTRLEKIKTDNRQLLDEIQRERTFIDFHHATVPLLRTEMAKLENVFGAVNTEWEPVHGATYMVPHHPNATLDQVEASTKTLNLNANGMTTADVRADMAKMKGWLDGVSPQDKGSTWNTLKRQYDKLAFNDLNFTHAEIQGGWLTRVIGPLTDRLKFVGTPAARAAAKRLESMQFWQGSKSREAHQLGTKWAVAESRAMKACGIERESTFRDMIYRPALSYIEKRQDILASSPNVADAENGVLRALNAYFMAEPETASVLSKPGAWLAVEQYLRQTARVSTWLDQNRKEMGLKIRDDGPEGTLYRESIGAPPFTVLRGISGDTENLYNAMKEQWANADLDPEGLAEAYRTDPDALRTKLATLFNSEVWNKFVAPIVHRTGRSSFYGPPTPSGVLPMALRERVIKAFEAAGGDVVDFAEKLFALEGGGVDQAAFIGETLGTLNSFFRALHAQHQDIDKANHYGLPVPRRYLMDARKSEEFPAEWLDYMPYDTHTMRQLVKMQSFEKAFGRDMAAMRQDFHTAIKEQAALRDRHSELMSRFPDKKGRGLRDAMKAEASRLGWNFEATENAERNLDVLRKAESQFNALLKMNSDRPIEIQPWVEILSALTAATVQGPGTAGVDTISIIEQPFRKLGLSMDAIRWAAGATKDFGQIAWGSLLQATGRTAWADSQHMKMLVEFGVFDDDATLTLKEKMTALASETTPATGPLKAGVMAARAMRMLLGTGFGSAKPGAEVIYPTVKPHAPFTQQAQTAHAATIVRWWKTYEEMVGKAVKYLQAHTTDMADPAFEFQPQHLGYKPGFFSGDRGWQYLRESLERYGVSLEQEARSAVDRRIVDPDAPLLTREAYRAIASHGQNEITLESGIATRPPGFITNPVLQMVNPLLGWAVSKSHDAWRSMREPNGERSRAAFMQGMWAYAAILPIGLAYALMRDEYDEQIVGRKQNVMHITSDNPFLAMLDNMSRVGTFGFAGELVNSLLNVDTQREMSVDSRVFFVSALLNTQRTISTWIRQGEADWATVYRPFMQGLGGSGYIQYADILNTALGLDNQEARVAKRISVNNYLRSAGRAIELDVRTGRGMAAVPNPIKPFVGQMVLAAYANDPVGFRHAQREAIMAARGEKKPDPDDYVQRSFAAYHPLKLVFRTEPSEDDYRRLLLQMDDDGRQTVSTAIRLFNGYAEQIGAKGSLGKVAQKPKAAQPMFRISSGGGASLDDARRRAALFGH